MSFNIKKSSGFTLIELLVVISIIGILSSFAIVSLNTARAKARDALRKGDMAQLRTALNLYYDDFFTYPACDDAVEDLWDEDDGVLGSNADIAAVARCYNINLTDALGAGTRPILDKMPKDPKNMTNQALSTGGNDTYLYRYISTDNGSEYGLIYYLEDDPLTAQVIKGY